MKRLILTLPVLVVWLFILETNISAKTGETTERTVLKENDYMEEYMLEDQHGVLHTLQKDTEKVIISFDMELSKAFHKWLNDKESTFLVDHKIEYIIDITKMPNIITWLFALPKMRRYGFQILLIREGHFGDKFPKQEGKFTVIKLGTDHKVNNISYLDKMDAIAESIE